MKIKNIVIRFAWLAAALLPLRGVCAADNQDESDRSSQVRVDVVVDMTEAGHKITHPTPDRPAYYLPISVGYKEFGFAHHFQRPPPQAWEIEHALAKALYEQGYQLMTKEGHPSLVLVFWWGYMAPEEDDVNHNTFIATKPGAFSAGAGSQANQGGAGGMWGPGSSGGLAPALAGNFLGGSFGYALGYSPPGGESLTKDPATTGFEAFPQFSIGFQNLNEQQMLSMVAGDTINDHQKFPDPRLDDVVQMTTEPRYYVLVSAFDFQSWLHHHPVLLWRAHVSTELWGHYFDQVIGPLISTAAPLFGRETKVPHFVSVPIFPVGRVIVGAPQVKDYPTLAK